MRIRLVEDLNKLTQILVDPPSRLIVNLVKCGPVGGGLSLEEQNTSLPCPYR